MSSEEMGKDGQKHCQNGNQEWEIEGKADRRGGGEMIFILYECRMWARVAVEGKVQGDRKEDFMKQLIDMIAQIYEKYFNITLCH